MCRNFSCTCVRKFLAHVQDGTVQTCTEGTFCRKISRHFCRKHASCTLHVKQNNLLIVTPQVHFVGNLCRKYVLDMCGSTFSARAGNMLPFTLKVASFPGPAQLSVTCSMEKPFPFEFFVRVWGEPGNEAKVTL